MRRRRAYASATASQLSPSCPHRAVLPVFALLTRAAADVGLMASLGATLRSLGLPSRAERPALEGVPRAPRAAVPPWKELHSLDATSKP